MWRVLSVHIDPSTNIQVTVPIVCSRVSVNGPGRCPVVSRSLGCPLDMGCVLGCHGPGRCLGMSWEVSWGCGVCPVVSRSWDVSWGCVGVSWDVLGCLGDVGCVLGCHGPGGCPGMAWEVSWGCGVCPVVSRSWVVSWGYVGVSWDVLGCPGCPGCPGGVGCGVWGVSWDVTVLGGVLGVLCVSVSWGKVTVDL